MSRDNTTAQAIHPIQKKNILKFCIMMNIINCGYLCFVELISNRWNFHLRRFFFVICFFRSLSIYSQYVHDSIGFSMCPRMPSELSKTGQFGSWSGNRSA